MKPFYDVINEESGPIFLLEQNEQISSPSGLKHICPNIVTDESHTIQTHRTTLQMFVSTPNYLIEILSLTDLIHRTTQWNIG